MKYREILIIMNNKPGVLSKISGLFQKRGINIETITAGESYPQELVRMTVCGNWDEYAVHQIMAQAEKLFDVRFVKEFDEKNSVDRELALIKLKADDSRRAEIMQVTTIYRGNIVDVGRESLIIEITGGKEKIEGFLDYVETFGILEVARTGVTSMTRGSEL
ncbi:acetolactate synthase small subunit [uncultured Ilyobacter sp.]|uniref:acetolactate synthase small subunit n=1 Tax=uncultured Ilyobacter sp. TaxID=544433 RepID=UPI0029C7D733|nr:acetolactate synthase small subunit [uncultured Ilyobacter sp.]